MIICQGKNKDLREKNKAPRPSDEELYHGLDSYHGGNRRELPVLRSSCRATAAAEDGNAMEGYPSKLVSSVMGYASEGSALFEACGGAMGFSP